MSDPTKLLRVLTPAGASVVGAKLPDGTEGNVQQALDGIIPAVTTTVDDAAKRAEDARDSALLLAGIYDTTALGLAATTSGQYFSIPSPVDVEFLILYKNSAGNPVAIDTYPNNKALTKVTNTFTEMADRNNVLFGVWDLANRLGLDLGFDGKFNIGNFKDVVGHILALEARGMLERTDRSGNLFSVTDLSDALALAIAADGSLIIKGRNILAELDAVKSAANNSKWITPSRNLATWGDSLSNNSYQKFLKEMQPDRNIGIGSLPGKKSGQIARLQGGIAPMITIVGNRIPASGSVAVTVDVPFLNNSNTMAGFLYGVYGLLSTVDDNHSFTRATAGSSVEIDPITPFIKSVTDYDDAHRTTVIWAGNNDFEALYRPEVDGNVQRMVDYLKPQDKRFIIIGMAIADYPERRKGSVYYNDIMALHKKWRERWPDNFIDITPILQRRYDPNNPTDVQNLIDGCTPSSLRVDEIHLNDAGQRIVAEAINAHLILRGW